MIAAILSGGLTALSFPTVLAGHLLPRTAWLAWVSLVPLYRTLREATPRGAFLRGLLWGVSFYGLSLYWIFTAMHTYGEVPVWGSLLGLVLLVLIFALFIGGAAALAAWLRSPRISFVIPFTLVWVAQDFLRNYFPFGGFAWSNLAYSQAPFLPMVQVLDLAGVYGVTFLLLLINGTIGERFPKRLLGVLIVLLVGDFLYGHFRMKGIEVDFSTLPAKKIAIIQANIPQDEKWQEERVQEIINRHIAMTEEASLQGVDLVVWPEASFPALVPPDILTIEPLEGLTVPLLMGGVTYQGVLPEVWPVLPSEAHFILHNSALTIDPGGWITGEYHKNHLVPMGEYVPFQRFFFFLDKIVPAFSSFTPGRTLNLLGAAGVPIGVTICYEDLFPEISRVFVRKGAGLLANLTNDAWYGRSSAILHHLDFSRLRAIENRRFLVRATNTGVTGIFDPLGRLVASAPTESESILTGEAKIGGPISFYTRKGDWFAWGCVLILALLGVGRVAGGRRRGTLWGSGDFPLTGPAP